MGDHRRHEEKDSATRPKEPRGRGRTARKYTESGKNECSGGRGKSQTLGRATTLKEVNGNAVGQSCGKKQSQVKPQKAQQSETKINSAPDNNECAQSEVKLSGRTNKSGKTGNEKIVKKRVNGLVQGRTSRTESTEESEDCDRPSQINRQTKQSPPGKGKSSKLRHVVESLRLKMKDISNAADKINTIVDTIIHEVSEKDLLFQDIKGMSTGSYYEGVKISNPNEFDIMVKVPIQKKGQRFALTEFDKTGAFYTLTCKRSTVDFLKDYTDDDGKILSQKVISRFRKCIKAVISDMPAVTILRKKPLCPAVTLIIKNKPTDISVDLVLALEIKQSWPEKTRDGMNIDGWLGKKVKRDLKFNPFYMVAKQADKGKESKDTWRISFSHIEKEILLNHGSTKTCCEGEGEKCCRKQCLKLLKYLLEMLGKNGMKGKMDNFCSYHAKTALLHHCTRYPKDEDWKLEDLDVCFNRYIAFFQDCLKNAKLPNFFIPSLNMFSSIKTDCSLLHRMIEDQKRNNYALFYS
ncbi:cyclic GMP-AMP synthase-like [Pseudophryne corroboree]|uniref:cyclic GMP-AMP synthase-like n=1 Tax=Pseudophryne corroboree TaxID=495146 RepID=UPI003081730B